MKNEVNGPSHQCDACHGGGWTTRHDGPSAISSLCPVCLGEGRCSDRVTVAQAMADAETLRSYVLGHARVSSLTNIARAGRSGAYARLMIEQADEFPGTSADRAAGRAAHFARLAVPALRGER